MGSGESDETAGSLGQLQNSSLNFKFGAVAEKNNNPVPKPSESVDEEDWMFKTFEPPENAKQNNEHKTARLEPEKRPMYRLGEDSDGEPLPEEDNPFELAVVSAVGKAEFDELACYMEQMDAIVEGKY